MEKQLLIICDPDAAYAGMLAAYMNERGSLPFRAEPFTDRKKASAYACSEHAQLVLLNEQFYTDGEPDRKVQKDSGLQGDRETERTCWDDALLILLLESGENASDGVSGVRKFQSADALIRQVLELYASWQDAGTARAAPGDNPAAVQGAEVRDDGSSPGSGQACNELQRREPESSVRTGGVQPERGRQGSEWESEQPGRTRQERVKQESAQQESAHPEGTRSGRQQETEEAQLEGGREREPRNEDLTDDRLDRRQAASLQRTDYRMQAEHEQVVREALSWTMPQTKLIGVYSPVARCGKTSFAITLGEMLAFHARMLYVNMEEYSGFSALTGDEQAGDITDLLYYAISGSTGRLVYKLNGLVRTFERLDYIPPASHAGDLRTQSAQQWCTFLARLAAEEAYEGVILDIGSAVEEVYRIMELCDRIYVPVLDDPWSRAKLRQFREAVVSQGSAALSGKIRYLQLPPPGKEEKLERLPFPDRIVRGRMGDYVRKLMHSSEKVYLPG